ncbi:putative RNA-directed DNA polymerase from transposon X-element [Araneus ventricosus]|uniref:Putative RNA-directed DNA polymerase from transposon X-element n=1 Tax=Araneus ventricosus TaxID=182803 RepID=A0A4Y2H7I4_ARAVE|nr:putative RNA-directed DNA polymerase from transposon X-element [Araneus ventricosus]
MKKKKLWLQGRKIADRDLKNSIGIWACKLGPIGRRISDIRDRLKFPNYLSYRTDRLTHRGGGTGILIRNSIDHHPTLIASTTFENTTIELHLPDSTPITISSIYRPPYGSISTLELNNIFNSNSKCIAVDDFNAKYRAWSSGTWNSNGTIIHDYICNNSLILLAPCEPTHFLNHSNNPSTLHFLILKNFSSGDANSINALSSDHNPVSFEIDINVNLPAISRIIKTTNWSKFKQIISTCLPGYPNIQNIKDIDEAITKLNNAILTAINLAFRSKLINGNYRKLPPNIVKKITLRNQIRKRRQQTYDPRYRRTANRLTNQIRREIRDYDQESWKKWLMSLNQEDNSIYIAARKFSRKYIQIPPILDTNGNYRPISLLSNIGKNSDDTAILAQGSTINYVIHTLQKGLNNIEKWCTLWRVAINTDKTHAVMFRKGTSRKELKTLSFFDEDLTWDKEVKYLGLILDDKLTFRSHLKYNTEKFWAKVHLLIPLIGRRSPLTLENKLLLFKQVLRPIFTYVAQIWGLAAFSNRKKAQILQNKILRIIVNHSLNL